MPHLYLVRHGRTAWNLGRRTQGHADVPLDEEGLRQAERLTAILRGEGLRRLYVSPLQRAVQTAQPIAQASGLEMHLDDRLRERNWGDFQGLTARDAALRYPEEDAFLHAAPRTARPPGGESFEELCARVEDCLREIAAEDDSPAAVVCHGGTISAGLQVLLGMTGWPKQRFIIDNASVSLVECRPTGEVIAHFVNRTGSLA